MYDEAEAREAAVPEEAEAGAAPDGAPPQYDAVRARVEQGDYTWDDVMSAKAQDSDARAVHVWLDSRVDVLQAGMAGDGAGCGCRRGRHRRGAGCRERAEGQELMGATVDTSYLRGYADQVEKNRYGALEQLKTHAKEHCENFDGIEGTLYPARWPLEFAAGQMRDAIDDASMGTMNNGISSGRIPMTNPVSSSTSVWPMPDSDTSSRTRRPARSTSRIVASERISVRAEYVRGRHHRRMSPSVGHIFHMVRLAE